MRKSLNTKVKVGAKKACLRIPEAYSAPRKTYFRKISCFSKSGLCFSGARACSFLGGACFVGLLLMAFLAINPIVSPAYAEESVDAVRDNTSSADVSAQDATTSSVTFSFGDPVGVDDLTPVSSNGASAKYSVKATVSVENSGGYAVYLGSNKSELVGKNTGVAINSVTSSSTYEGLPLNSWGYNAVEGETAGDSFQAIPTNNRGDIIGENTSNNIKSDEKTFTLSFATHIGNDKPADTYENQVTMSVVSSPLEIVNDFGIATMQEMTSAICNAATDNDNDGQISAQLEDIRDGKYYWVTKLADNKCWMTQNLDLDLSTSKTLTSADTDVASNWTPAYTTATVANNSTILANNTGQRSWSLGDYRITNPTASNTCGGGKNDLSQCPTQFTSYITPTIANGEESAHYIVGNHYQWNAATAGTGGSITSGQVTGSICPKGWRLPTSTDSGEFKNLANIYSVSSEVAKLVSLPLYFVRGGYIGQGSGLFADAGTSGSYWSSTPSSNAGQAYYFDFGSTSRINFSGVGYRQLGFSVRCIAR